MHVPPRHQKFDTLKEQCLLATSSYCILVLQQQQTICINAQHHTEALTMCLFSYLSCLIDHYSVSFGRFINSCLLRKRVKVNQFISEKEKDHLQNTHAIRCPSNGLLQAHVTNLRLPHLSLTKKKKKTFEFGYLVPQDASPLGPMSDPSVLCCFVWWTPLSKGSLEPLPSRPKPPRASVLASGRMLTETKKEES